jgi:TIGR03009 family protein
MRLIAVTVCLLMSAPLWGQLPDDPKERTKWLDAVLDNWELVMTKVQTLEAKCERTTDDKVFNNKEIYRGSAKFMKGTGPGMTSRASLYMQNVNNTKVYEHLILSGAFLYEVAPAAKEIRVHKLPEPQAGQNVDHNLLALLFGMKAKDAKQRYQIDLVKADQHYFYLRVEPKMQNDKADFAVAQLALVRSTYLPRQLEFQQANKNVVRWDLPEIQTPANLRPADFEPPALPAGWKMNQIPSGGAGASKVRSTGN